MLADHLTGKKKELKDMSFCKMTIFYNSDNFLQEYSNLLETWCVMLSSVSQEIYKKYCTPLVIYLMCLSQLFLKELNKTNFLQF